MITLSQNFTTVLPGVNFVQFVASGGTPEYSYMVVPGGAGGTVDSSTGNYTAPPTITLSPRTAYDIIQVTDDLGDTVEAQILVTDVIGLVCDIIQTGLGLENGRVYEWNQKIFQPQDYGLYAIVSVVSCKPFGNSYAPNPTDGSQAQQFVSMYSRIDIDLISRGPAARQQKELLLLALNNTYSQQQQNAMGFYIGKLPISGGFLNLSNVDASAIPYRFKISYALQYQINLTQSVPYYDTFAPVQVVTNS